MDERTSRKIGNIFSNAIIEAIPKPKKERLKILAASRTEALGLCKSDEDRRQVECRHLEADASSSYSQSDSSEALDKIMSSPFFGGDRRQEMIEFCKQMISKTS